MEQTNKTILTIDVGTSSMRSIVYSYQGTINFTKQINYSPIFMDNNLVEMDAIIFKETLENLVSSAVEYSNQSNTKIIALSITSQRSSVIPVDIKGNPLYNTIIWQDKRCDYLCKELENKNDIIYKISGLPITSVFSAIKMKWFKLNEPKIYQETYKMVGIHDYLLYILTNKFITDRSLASRTNLLDLTTLEWSEKAIEIFDIDKDKLCALADQGDVVGFSTSLFESSTGLEAGTKIISAGGDQQCAALGVGNIKNNQIEVNIGTGGYVIANSNKPIFDKNKRVFCNVSAMKGKYIIEGSILTSGVLYKFMKENYFYGDNEYTKINEEVKKSPIGSNGLIMLPYLKGRGTPFWNPDAKGVFYNVCMESTRGDFARSALESIALEINDNINFVEDYTGKLKEILCCGGLTNFDEFIGMLADSSNKTCIKYDNGEATAIGAFISAAVTLKIFNTYEEAFYTITKSNRKYKYDSNKYNHELYLKIKEDKEQLYNKLFL